MDHFQTSHEHILAELERIDVLVRAQVWRVRQQFQTENDWPGLAITDGEIDQLLETTIGLPGWARTSGVSAQVEIREALTQLTATIAQRKRASGEHGIDLRLERLAHLAELSAFDIEALLICLAPELDLRYERFYAYLQDDVTRKRPSVDLILNLLSPTYEAKLANLLRFTPGAPLIKHRLLRLDDAHTTLLSAPLQLDERIVAYLLDSDELDQRLGDGVRLISPAASWSAVMLEPSTRAFLDRWRQTVRPGRDSAVFYFQGPYGVGKRETAEGLCATLDLNLLVIRGPDWVGASEPDFREWIALLEREAALQRAAVYWEHFDELCEAEPKLTNLLLDSLSRQTGITFLAGAKSWTWAEAASEVDLFHIVFPRPAAGDRLTFWRQSLDGRAPSHANSELIILADKFKLSGGQIQNAVGAARRLAQLRDPQHGRISIADLYQASRLQSNQKLGTLATKIVPHYTWPDIVLPDDLRRQLHELCDHVTYRAQVLEGWGFERKLSLGKGVNALFSGPSGTGKTMAAEIIAGELGLDLYKIDLSTVVSKYIGETEKNLARIFAEAETSNAILFFDEADALFGKRSEVKDAHDRFANIEISYLLQKMEEYDGVVVLATNLRRNLDDAFVRRMTFILHFPMPGPSDRLRIWRGIWPEETPLDAELDLPFMAEQFKLSGGSIKNIALSAAYLAAADGGRVEMAHLVHATRREFQKMGKVVVEEAFGPYATLAEPARKQQAVTHDS